MNHIHRWRRHAAALLTTPILASVLLLGASPATTEAHYDVDNPFVFYEGGSQGWDRYVGVCYPFDGNDWDISGNLKHSAINQAMNEWNDQDREIHLYRAQATCQYMWNNYKPFIRIAWDDQCLKFEFTTTCDITSAMGTNPHEVTEHGSQANAWSSDGNGGCHSEGTCIVWAEILVNHDMSGLYWGSDMWYNFNNNKFTALGAITHEFGHALGVGLDIPRYAPPYNNDPGCDDFTYPVSSNELMCAVIEHREWNTILKAHDIQQLQNTYTAHVW